MMMPRALPRFSGGKTEVTIVIPRVKIIAPPIPWITLATIRTPLVGAHAPRMEARISSTMPIVNTLFLPKMSEALPKGTQKPAAARRYPVDTQLMVMTFMERSCPMLGRETITEEAM
jgi:hypothetical protein